MSPRLGRLQVLSGSEDFLGNDSTVMDAVSGQTLADFDQELSKLLAAAEQRATDALTAQRDTLEGMAEALEAEETLEEAGLVKFLSAVRAAVADEAGGNGAGPSDGPPEPANRPPRRKRPAPSPQRQRRST
jgi:hypothetical protein